MAKFLSEEWINLYKEEWNKNEKLKEGLKTFEESLRMMGKVPTEW
ncbi:conserved hypothetical protein [Sulfurihydrogenibium azorense Az-Fu1]|uniref:Uncharacterized protein n=1 Tax=Sulfurihydrogenibium azorense (strain DSM 15241 / OCM 825 / Az-Fu1) TaxID=204536 RepID=C1DWV6_SULAA|nr:hypothetical protein [Sulfurihydrogenibium azorense]ACN98213.1 conserved hypothetical protein [Sulfurihydrogenibium azorense Az-Fu1]